MYERENVINQVRGVMRRKTKMSNSRRNNNLGYRPENEESESDSDFEALEFTTRSISRAYIVTHQIDTNKQMIEKRIE